MAKHKIHATPSVGAGRARTAASRSPGDVAARLRVAVAVMLVAAATAPLAAVPVGTVALYSNGNVEKLLSADRAGLLWEDDRKRRYLRSRNPVVPVVTRSTFLSGRQTRREVVAGDPDAIATAARGAWVEFTVERTRYTGERSNRSWRCARGRTHIAKVAGADRRVTDFVCERFVVHRKYWQPVIKERREFSYSEDLGLVTRMARTRGEKTSRWRLVKLIAPKRATYKRLSKQVRKLRQPKKGR
ncbi:MAG: hypothetical protein QNJ91_08205 [Gammaproteobacteria bacterium]|nr:hypothetical protein [Gammaproteobacteria bacterium]